MKKFLGWLGFDTGWKQLLVSSQKEICDALANIIKLDSLNFLRNDEIEVYRIPLKFMNEASKHVGHMVEIDNQETNVVVEGLCIGYGSFINNIQRDETICSTIRKFYVVQIAEDREKLVTFEEGMFLYVDGNRVIFDEK